MSYFRRTPNYPRDNNNAFNTTGSLNHNADAQNHNNNAFNTNNSQFNANTIVVIINSTSNEIEDRSAVEIARRIPETLSPPFLASPPNPDSILREATTHEHQEWLQITTEGLSLEGSPGATLERINAQGGRISGVPLTDRIQSSNMGMPAAPPMSHTIPSTYFLAKPPIPSTIVPPIDNPKKEIIIAVMGPAGAGKSYFIREMIAGISQSDIELCETSGWTKVRSFSFPYGPTKITLFDTPDFRNAGTGDYEMLAEISDWMSSAYRQGTLLSGIIYLHNIHWLHENFWATEHLMMFQKLCGPSALQNVLLTTTQWSNANLAAEESRENTLRTSSHWRELITGGAAVKRFMGTRESGLELIDQLIKKEPKPLLIQHQMVDEDMILEETDVGQCMGWT